MNSENKLSRSKQTAAKTLLETFKILQESGGHLAGREVVQKIRERIKLDNWEKEIYVQTWYVRWESILHFYTVDCLKAWFLRKDKWIWYLTEDGEKMIVKGWEKIIEESSKAYKKWASENKKIKNNKNISLPELQEEVQELEENLSQTQKANLDLLEDQAIDGIKNYIKDKNPYEFQDLVAALLRAMGYHTPFISPKWKDGGLDVIAYNDPLGATTPRLKVQVKHRPDSAIAVDDIRNLISLLNTESDVGVFVTSGRFTSEAERSARESHKHIKLLDMDNFIALWQEFYEKMNDEDKNILPLQPIYFLGSNE